MSWHDRLFKTLIRLLPAEFRGDYEREMAAMFRAERRDADGPASLTRVWLAAIADVFRFFAGAARTMTGAVAGEYIAGFTSLIRRDPIGVVASVAFMTAVTIGWLALGDQNVPTRSYRTTPAAFSKQVSEFTARFATDSGAVRVPPGEDGYMMAARYAFFPELVLTEGKEYTIWFSSMDALHGLSIVGGGQNINLEIAPNHAYGATGSRTGIGRAGLHLFEAAAPAASEDGVDHPHVGDRVLEREGKRRAAPDRAREQIALKRVLVDHLEGLEPDRGVAEL